MMFAPSALSAHAKLVRFLTSHNRSIGVEFLGLQPGLLSH